MKNMYSKDGSIGAYASADLSIGVFDTINLQVNVGVATIGIMMSSTY
jgi:hypothetical protein